MKEIKKARRDYKRCPLLKGVNEIKEAWEISEGQFYLFLKFDRFPVRKINDRYYAHYWNMDEFFMELLKRGADVNVDIDINDNGDHE